MAEDLAAEHRDAAKLAELAGRALLELRADPPPLRDIGAAGDRMAHQLLVAELNRLYPDDDVRSAAGPPRGHGPWGVLRGGAGPRPPPWTGGCRPTPRRFSRRSRPASRHAWWS